MAMAAWASLADEHRPQVRAIGPPRAEVDDGGDVMAGGVEVAGPSQEPGRHAVGVHRRPRPMLDGLGGEDPQVVGPGARSGELELLRHADVAVVRFSDVCAEGSGLGDQLLSVVEAPLE